VGVLLAVAAATQVAAASERFVPDRPDFVVANVRQAMPDEALTKLIERQKAAPACEQIALELASALIERTRRLREPRFMGRAEALLAPLAAGDQASRDARRLYAGTLQYRHEFSRAMQIFDQLIHEQPHDEDTRLRRASLRLTRGDFAGARADCAWVASLGGSGAPAGFACLSESLASAGQLTQGLELLQVMDNPKSSLPDDVRAYLLATRAALHDRSGQSQRAIESYREALALVPEDDSIRGSLADVLAWQGDRPGALKLVTVENPSLALLVREASLTDGAGRQSLVRRARDWLQLEIARGDAGHAREAAILDLASGDGAAALESARRNFRLQRELTRHFFMHENEKVLITFSAGVALRRPNEGQTDLVKRADTAMYQAKRTGKNRVVVAD